MKTASVKLILLAMLLISVRVSADVSGTVSDSGGVPVEYVLVMLNRADGTGAASYDFTDTDGAFTIEVTDVSVGNGDEPSAFSLGNAYPNPFNPSTTIPFNLEYPAGVNIEIFNIAGQRVKILVDGMMNAGRHTAVWDGSDNDMRPLAAGVYFFRLQAGGRFSAGKLLKLDGSSPATPPSSAPVSANAAKKAGNLFDLTVLGGGIEMLTVSGIEYENTAHLDLTVERRETAITGIDPREAYELITKAGGVTGFTVLDVRTEREYAESRIEGARNYDITADTFVGDVAGLDKNAVYLVYCYSGSRSLSASTALESLGFRNLFNMRTGILGWLDEGLPVEYRE